jgi:hypothetical protein
MGARTENVDKRVVSKELRAYCYLFPLLRLFMDLHICPIFVTTARNIIWASVAFFH